MSGPLVGHANGTEATRIAFLVRMLCVWVSAIAGKQSKAWVLRAIAFDWAEGQRRSSSQTPVLLMWCFSWFEATITVVGGGWPQPGEVSWLMGTNSSQLGDANARGKVAGRWLQTSPASRPSLRSTRLMPAPICIRWVSEHTRYVFQVPSLLECPAERHGLGGLTVLVECGSVGLMPMQSLRLSAPLKVCPMATALLLPHFTVTCAPASMNG